eukprot:m.45283 g.45283  ORF g.45283 m.45283 type:complete len:203 (-) comp6630_c0_seq2:51-659(-)
MSADRPPTLHATSTVRQRGRPDKAPSLCAPREHETTTRDANKCRICFEAEDDREVGESDETGHEDGATLTRRTWADAPCDCKGTAAHVHTECLQAWRITAVERGQADVCGVCLAAFRGLPDPCDPDTTTRPSWLQGLYSMAQRVPPIVLTVAWTSTTATLLYVIFRLKFEQEMARQALYLSVYNDFSSSFAALSVIDSGGVL